MGMYRSVTPQQQGAIQTTQRMEFQYLVKNQRAVGHKRKLKRPLEERSTLRREHVPVLTLRKGYLDEHIEAGLIRPRRRIRESSITIWWDYGDKGEGSGE